MSLVSNLILPVSNFNQKTAPDWFLKDLKSIDWRLMVYWNHMRERWIVDRCTRGVSAEDLLGDGMHSHSNECPRTNVLVVRGPSGQYHPLGQDVIDWFKANDVGSQHKDAQTLINEYTAKEQAESERLRLLRKDNTHHVTLDHKRQLLEMKSLMDKHDLRPNK